MRAEVHKSLDRCLVASQLMLLVLTLVVPSTSGVWAGPRPNRDGSHPTPFGLRASTVEGLPVWSSRLHYINDIWLALTTSGQIGAGRVYVGDDDGASIAKPRVDLKQLGITWTPSLEFPPHTQNDYLYWMWPGFGCVRGQDTLMTWGGDAFADISESSSLRSFTRYDPSAKADQQYYVAYSDTSWYSRSSYDYYEGRLYIPIKVEIHQTSYAWSMRFAKRFILFDYWIVNIGTQPIVDGVFGINVYPFILNDELWDPRDHFVPELMGLLSTTKGLVAGTVDTMNIAWYATHNGDPLSYAGFERNCPNGVVGLRVLRMPPGGKLTYNWYAYHALPSGRAAYWGPSRHPGVSYGDGADPEGSRGWYRMMTNGEVDYDQVYTAIDQQAHGWGPPPSQLGFAIDLADGSWGEYVVSTGKIDPIAPGDSVPFTMALVVGENFHTKPRNFLDNFDAYNPEPFLANLNYSDLIENARWAGWMFDLPGYDTDGDGNRGRSYGINCNAFGCDSLYYVGDGVPDFSGPRPPTPPSFETATKPGAVILRWSGALPETEIDPMSGVRDFEGYRIYAGRFNTDDRLSLLASWDLEDYKRMVYDPINREWGAASHPYSVGAWKEIMDDPSFDPRDYRVPSLAQAFVDSTADTITNSIGQMWIIWTERYSYWETQEANFENVSDDGSNGAARNLIQRIATVDTLIGESTVTYGIYEAVIENLNPSIPLFFALTTLDFGNPAIDLDPLESYPSNNVEYAEPMYSTDVVVDSGLRVGVYPNPYKLAYRDGQGEWTSYYQEGYEGRGIHKFEEQDRRVHFINLPDTATIRIYTLDGDLVRTIHHPDPFLTTYPSSVGWDLVSRNVQAVVSGIYIWRVDSRLGSQMGKLVIIK